MRTNSNPHITGKSILIGTEEWSFTILSLMKELFRRSNRRIQRILSWQRTDKFASRLIRRLAPTSAVPPQHSFAFHRGPPVRSPSPDLNRSHGRQKALWNCRFLCSQWLYSIHMGIRNRLRRASIAICIRKDLLFIRNTFEKRFVVTLQGKITQVCARYQ